MPGIYFYDGFFFLRRQKERKKRDETSQEEQVQLEHSDKVVKRNEKLAATTTTAYRFPSPSPASSISLNALILRRHSNRLPLNQIEREIFFDTTCDIILGGPMHMVSRGTVGNRLSPK